MADNETRTITDENGNEIKDYLNSGNIINEFMTEVTATDFHVYGVSGAWGTGKTCFIRMWEDEMRKDAGNVVVHIDAFEKDYYEEPFLMIFEAIKDFMKECSKEKGDNELANKVIDIAKKIFNKKTLTKLASNYAFSKIGEVAGDKNAKLLEDVFEYSPEKEKIDLCKELKVALNTVVASTGKKLYIVVDELDRCRPDFALETLEKIKHLFAVDGIKFIIVYNPEVIKAIVKNRYGIDDVNYRYVTKFIEKDWEFNQSRFLSVFIENEMRKVTDSLQNRKEISPELKKSVQDFLSSLASATNLNHYFNNFNRGFVRVVCHEKLSLRDVQRIFASVDIIYAINACINNPRYDFERTIITAFTFEFLKAIDHVNFYNLKSDLKSYDFDANNEEPIPDELGKLSEKYISLCHSIFLPYLEVTPIKRYLKYLWLVIK